MDVVKQLSDRYLGKYAAVRDRDLLADERAGRADAERGLPALHDQVCHYAARLKSAARLDLERYSAGQQGVLREITDRRKTLSDEYDRLCLVRRPSLIEQREAEQEALARTRGPDSSAMSSLLQRSEKAEADTASLASDLGRPLQVSLKTSYPFIIAATGVAELPVNRMAFELFFQEAPAVSAGIALVLGLVIALLAHFVGLWARRLGHAKGVKSTLGYLGGCTLVLCIVLPLLYFIAALRQAYVKIIEAEGALDFGSLVQSGQLADAASRFAMSSDLGLVGWALFTVNLVIFTVAMICAFVRHDPDPDYEHLVVQADRLRRRLERCRSAFERRSAKIQRGYAERLQQLDGRADRLKAQCEQLDRQAAAVTAHGEVAARVIARCLAARIAAYRKGNLSGRADGCPESFRAAETDRLDPAIVGEVHA